MNSAVTELNGSYSGKCILLRFLRNYKTLKRGKPDVRLLKTLLRAAEFRYSRKKAKKCV